jgi:hypothetical protein
MMNEKQMKIKQDIDRTKQLKIKANEGTKGMGKYEESKQDNINRGKGLF